MGTSESIRFNFSSGTDEFVLEDFDQEDVKFQKYTRFSDVNPRNLRQYKEKIRSIAEKENKNRLLRREERLRTYLAYIEFPTIMGWYFGESPIKKFSMNEEWSQIFNDVERRVTKWKQSGWSETFTEKARKNFWPPNLLMRNKVFRTRGIYLDLDEILVDPPVTPPEMNFENLPRNCNQDLLEVPLKEKEFEVGDGVKKDHKAHLGTLMEKREEMSSYMHSLFKHSYYFDDSEGHFTAITTEMQEKLIWDSKLNIWRLAKKEIIYPNDFYFDRSKGFFIPKQRNKSDSLYEYDEKLGCYRFKNEYMHVQNKYGSTPQDFFFDEHKRVWKVFTDENLKKEVLFDENGKRYARKKGGNTPDDYYFDLRPKFLSYMSKVQPGSEYFWDAGSSVWISNRDAEFGLEVDKTASARYFWDEESECFREKDAPSALFAFDVNNKFYRKIHILKGKHDANNWKWNGRTKAWEYQKGRVQGYIQKLKVWKNDKRYEYPWRECSNQRDFDLDHYLETTLADLQTFYSVTAHREQNVALSPQNDVHAL